MQTVEEVKSQVEDMYQLKVSNIDKVKNVFRIQSDDGTLCLKVIKYEYGHFLFILSAIKHLQKAGFQMVPPFIKTASQRDFIKIGDCYAYLTEWVNAREANFDNPLDVLLAAGKLSELHVKSRGFKLTDDMHPRVGWFKWIETYRTRKNEILDFKRRIEEKDNKTEFDSLYHGALEEELQRAENAIDNLIETNYIMRMKKEIEYKGFCHHDFAHHNVLMSDSGKINIIDFDYCILDSNLHDLSSLIMRCMKNGKWSIENAIFIFDAYSVANAVHKIDIPIIAAFLEYPQDFWQVGIQYYWEKQPWGEEFFIKKLQKILEDRKMRQDFIDELRVLKYGVDDFK